MSLNSDRARLEYALKMIADIALVVDRHSGIRAALEDIEGHHALMMCCLQIGETLNRIQDAGIRETLPVNLAYGLRNIIAHNYLGLNPEIVAMTIEKDIPELKKAIESNLQRKGG